MAAEDTAGYVIVVDGFDKDSLTFQVIGEGFGPDQSLFFPRIDGKNNSVAKGILTHDPRQLHDQGGARGIISYAEGISGDITDSGIAAVYMPLYDDEGFIRGLTTR